MADPNRKIGRPVPCFRPCAACEQPMDLNAVYNFCQGVQCICTRCYRLGFRFDDAGGVVQLEEQPA